MGKSFKSVVMNEVYSN